MNESPHKSLSHHPANPPPQPYARFNFPLPEKRYLGMLQCQRDPLLMSCVSEVVRCDKRKAPAPSKSKAPVQVDIAEWEIELNDTVLFPEGGGQGSDQGKLTVVSSPSGATSSVSVVREVLRRQLDAVHFVDAPIEVGSQVLVEVDVRGRLDKMTQHTGQHLLSAVIDDQLQLDTLSWSLTAEPLPCYIELPRAPTPQEIQTIQDRCNELIRESRRIHVEMELVDEMPDSVPDDYVAQEGRKGVLRTVIIDRLDRNPCCGTHFPNLSHLQSLFVLPQTTSIRGTNCRLSFLVGSRVISHLSTTHSLLRDSSLAMNCQSTILASRITSLLDSSRDSSRREKSLRNELAGFMIEKMWAQTSDHGTSGILSGVVFREDDSMNSLEFLSQLAASLQIKLDGSGSQDLPHLFVFACGSTPGSTPPSGSIILVGSDGLLKDAVAGLGQKFGSRIKGGGKGRWQGKVLDGWRTGDEEMLNDLVLRK